MPLECYSAHLSIILEYTKCTETQQSKTAVVKQEFFNIFLYAASDCRMNGTQHKKTVFFTSFSLLFRKQKLLPLCPWGETQSCKLERINVLFAVKYALDTNFPQRDWRCVLVSSIDFGHCCLIFSPFSFSYCLGRESQFYLCSMIFEYYVYVNSFRIFFGLD